MSAVRRRHWCPSGWRVRDGKTLLYRLVLPLLPCVEVEYDERRRLWGVNIRDTVSAPLRRDEPFYRNAGEAMEDAEAQVKLWLGRSQAALDERPGR